VTNTNTGERECFRRKILEGTRSLRSGQFGSDPSAYPLTTTLAKHEVTDVIRTELTSFEDVVNINEPLPEGNFKS